MVKRPGFGLRVYSESKEDAYAHFRDEFKDSQDMAHNISPDMLPERYRVRLKDPTQFAQVHDLFCSGRFNDRGKEICNPGIDTVTNQRKLTVSGIYYTSGHRADAEAFRQRSPTSGGLRPPRPTSLAKSTYTFSSARTRPSPNDG
jgi:hypothetical protein